MLKKLQSLSEKQKIAIIVVVVVIATLAMGYFWVKDTMVGISKIGQVAKTIDLPKIDLPDFSTIMPKSDTDQNVPGNYTDDGKTYTNMEYGFEVQYPSDFPITKPINKDTEIGLLTLVFKQNGYYPIWLYVGGKDDEKLINQLNPEHIIGKDLKESKIDINGLKWDFIESDTIPREGRGMAQSISTYSVINRNNRYILQCINCNPEMFGDDAKNLRSVFDNIISTFKFTN